MEKISVIIPCRNEAKYIFDTVSSVIKQKNVSNNIEIIVVDGMSEDGTFEIVYKMMQKDQRIILLKNEKKNTPVALNIGIKKASGDFILILGAHARIDEFYISSCTKIFNKYNDVDCAGGPINSIGNGNLSKAIAITMSSPIGIGNAKHRFPEYEGYAEMACFPMYKSEVFTKIGMFDEELIRNQDDDFSFRLRLKGGKIFISPEAKSYYFVRDNLKKLFEQYFGYGYWRIALLKKHKLSISFRHQIPFLFFSIVILLLITGIYFDRLIISVIVPIIYITALIIFTILEAINTRKFLIVLLPVVAFVLHFSYALGFLSGLLQFIPFLKKFKFKT